MTVQKDLEKALAASESAKGTYATFAASTDDESAKQMFQKMSQDMDQHISNIKSRLDYTNQVQLPGSKLTSNTGNNSQQDYLQ